MDMSVFGGSNTSQTANNGSYGPYAHTLYIYIGDECGAKLRVRTHRKPRCAIREAAMDAMR